MNISTIRQNRFVRNFMRDKWLILSVIGIILAWAVVYLVFFYEPVYKSEAKVWIKDIQTENYVTEAGGREPESSLKPLTMAGNPVLTQIEILKSKEMEQYLAAYIRNQRSARVAHYVKNNPDPIVTKKIVKVKNEPGTDILSVEVKWRDPLVARDLLKVTLRKYEDINLRINRDIRTKKREYIDERIAEIETKLTAVRDKIREYQQGSLAVNVEEQAKELVRLRADMTARLEDAQAASSSSRSNVRELQGQLAMSPREALKAVALGSGNEALVKMRETMTQLQQQYAHDGIKLAPTNPKMIALKNQIDTLQEHINTEIRQTVGSTHAATGRRIYDLPRGNLVQELVSSRAKMMGLASEAASLRAGIARVDGMLRTLPQDKFALDGLMQEERALSLAFDELRRKQIEARIKEAETPSNVFVIDAPAIPESASFPTPLHILALTTLLGLVSGFGLSTLKTYTEDTCEGVEPIEQALGSKVLGIIPWLRSPVACQAPDSNVLSINDMSFKNIISNLRIQSDRQGAHAIAFTSTALQRPGNSTVYTLAYRLSRLGQSVVMIDGDFHKLGGEHPFTQESPVDLTELIRETDRQLKHGHEVYANDILSALGLDTHGVYLLTNRHDVDNAYDYFASKGFRHILSVLKAHFDWVLVDTPSALVAPEFLPIAQQTDGTVLFVDKQATYSMLKRTARKLKDAHIPLLGAVIREQNEEMEREHREYTHRRGGGGQGSIPVIHSAATVPIQRAPRRVEFMGAHIDALNMSQTLARVVEIIEKREMTQHVVVNVAKLVQMQKDPVLRQIVNTSGLVNADGFGVVLGARLLNLPIPERVTGIDLMQNLVHLSSNRQYRVFFFGADEEVVQTVVQNYRRQYPHLQVCGYRNGYYAPHEEKKIAEQIRDAAPDILFVAMGSPKKERFINKYKDMMNVPFVMGVGGSFDVVAGKVKRAPEWMQQAGLEWLCRLMQEPRRLWRRYLVTNAQYGLMLLNQMFTMRLRPSA